MSTAANELSRPSINPAHPHVPRIEPSSRRWLRAMIMGIPNLIVFSLLGGVMVYGHHTGWKLPTRLELMGPAAVVAEDWCTEHLVPESQCIECRTELYPKGEPLGFCREHGVAECVIHHPELAQVKGEVRLPGHDTVAAISLLARPANNSRNTLHTKRVQFTSAESVEKAGIEVDVVQEQPMRDAITANGELIFDPTRVAHLSTRVPGTIALVLKTLGDEVLAGDILALVDAAQVGQSKAEFVQAMVQLQLRRATMERLSPVVTTGAVPQKTLIEAESALQEAEVAVVSAKQELANLGFDLAGLFETIDPKRLGDELRFLGIPDSLVAALPPGMKTANLIPIRAPFGGVVVESDVVAGEVVDATNLLFTVADPQQLWLILHVRQEDASYVRRDLPVHFQTDHGAVEIMGKVAWISPAVNEQTRTLSVRVIVSNPQGNLRDKMFGTGRLILREEPRAIVVPRNAIQSTSDAHFIFVRDKHYFQEGAPKFFHVRQVRLGAQNDQYVELLAGALPGEVIASRGSNVLLAQLLRSNLGAGCGCHE